MAATAIKTQHLVRARPKSVEDMPQWAKCCDGYIKATQALGEMTIDLSTLHEEIVLGCAYCRTPNFGPRKKVKDTADGLFVSFDTLDLDEGELPVTH